MPFANERHVDTLLSNVSVKYRNSNYVAMEIFPEVPVKKDSDLYRTYDRNFRLPETYRADGGEARKHDFHVSTNSYVLEEHALKDVVTDRQAANYDLADLRSETTEELTDKILMRLEKSVASLMTDTAWSLNVSLATAQQWSLDTVTSNPILTMDTAGITILENSGMTPNKAVIPYRVMKAAKNHSSIIERIKYTSIDITPAMIAGLFDIDRVIVPKAVIDSSAEGVASSIGALWGDNIWVGYVTDRPGPRTPTSGYVFRSSIPMVRRWREEKLRGEQIEVGMLYQAKVVASLAGYCIVDALA